MKRFFYSSLLLFMGVIFSLGLFNFTNLTIPIKEESSPTTIENETITTSTSLTTSSHIFEEVANDGLASYLKISIPVAATTDLHTLVIKQTIGGTSYTLTKDELGNTCNYSDNHAAKNNTFYFTRPATYSVYYKTSNIETSETCTFLPSLNTKIIDRLFTSTNGGQTKHGIKKLNNNYYILNSGDITLPVDSFNLYHISAKSKDVVNDSLLSSIPNNACGILTYVIESSNLCTHIDLNITVITTNFTTEFYTLDNNSLIDKADKYFLSYGYCFNEGVKFITNADANATDLLGNNLTETETKSIFKYIKFFVTSKDRNAQNLANLEPTITPIELNSEGDNFISHTAEVSDHTIYTLSAYLGEKNNNIVFDNNICTFKVITKVPLNEQNAYIFSAVLGQGEQGDLNNYISGVLGGYINKNTTIYHPSAAVRLFYNGYQTKNTKLKYIYDNTEYSLNKGANKTITSSDKTSQNALIIENNSTIYLKNDTSNFDNFYFFPVTFSGYEAGYSFRNNLLLNNITINNSTTIEMAADTIKQISTPISSFKYVVPNSYETNAIPLHLRVTYNGTVFDDFINLQNNDAIEFYDYGNYILEFYNVASYDFLSLNDYTSQGIYYYRVEFTIAGPSIFAETATENPLTISNNMYTPYAVNCEVNLNAGQKFIAYKNNEEYATKDSSMSFLLNEVGNWRIDIVDSNNILLKRLSFTIMNTIYQGFSMNYQDEYESLVIYKKTSLSPVELEQLEQSSAYHLLEAGHYRLVMNTKESFPFKLNGSQTSAYTLTECEIDFEIAKSHFSIEFLSGSNGSRTSDAIEIVSVSGARLQTLEVFKNGKLVQTYTQNQLADWEAVLNKSFKDNGLYTFKLTDAFGNTHETQIEKYYKVNFALIMLILIIVVAVIALFVIIIKARHRVSVK